MDRRNIQEVEPHFFDTPQRLAFILLAQKVINSLLLLRFNDALHTKPYSGSNTIFNLVTAAIRNDYKKNIKNLSQDCSSPEFALFQTQSVNKTFLPCILTL